MGKDWGEGEGKRSDPLSGGIEGEKGGIEWDEAEWWMALTLLNMLLAERS